MKIEGLDKLEGYIDEGHIVEGICQNGDDIILVSFENNAEFEIKINKKGLLEVVQLFIYMGE